MTESLLAAARRLAPGLIVAAACMASACDEPLRDIIRRIEELEDS